MIITCPSCDAKFKIKDEALLPNGRKVKCVKCEHRWHQNPAEPSDAEEAAAPAPKPVKKAPAAPPPPPGAAPKKKKKEEEYEVSKPYVREDDDIPVPPRMSGGGKGLPEGLIKWILWGVFGVVLLAVLITVFLLRETVMNKLPSMATVYEKMGMHDPVEEFGLKIERINSDAPIENGNLVLVITGVIKNVATKTQVVPPLRVSLRNSQDQEIFYWIHKMPDPQVMGGAVVSFETRMPSPPDEATKVTVSFVLEDEKGKKLGGKQKGDAAKGGDDHGGKKPAAKDEHH